MAANQIVPDHLFPMASKLLKPRVRKRTLKCFLTRHKTWFPTKFAGHPSPVKRLLLAMQDSASWDKKVGLKLSDLCRLST